MISPDNGSRSSLPKQSDSNSKQTTKNKNKNQQNSKRLRKSEKDIFKLTNRYDGINCDLEGCDGYIPTREGQI